MNLKQIKERGTCEGLEEGKGKEGGNVVIIFIVSVSKSNLKSRN